MLRASPTSELTHYNRLTLILSYKTSVKRYKIACLPACLAAMCHVLTITFKQINIDWKIIVKFDILYFKIVHCPSTTTLTQHFDPLSHHSIILSEDNGTLDPKSSNNSIFIETRLVVLLSSFVCDYRIINIKSNKCHRIFYWKNRKCETGHTFINP